MTTILIKALGIILALVLIGNLVGFAAGYISLKAFWIILVFGFLSIKLVSVLRRRVEK